MIEAFLDFFQLYTVDADYLPDFWLTMILLYLNAGLYLNDLYNLVKRKSKAETFSLMAIPGVFAVIFVLMLSIFAHVPNLQSIASQAKRLSLLITAIQPQTNLALLLIVFLYPILWGIGLLRQKRHEHGSRKRWVLSCIPDYIAWIILILGIGYHLFFGENILNSVLENAKEGDLLALYGSHGTWLYIWMYGIYILACKEAVLLVGLLSELLLMRIPLRYHSGQNAVTFVSFYYLFCQNAIFRGISLLEAALVIPLCGVMLRDDIRSHFAADRRSVCRSYRHWSGHADTFLLRCMGTAQADQRAFLYGIFSHAASFQQQIVHGHSSFYH